MKSRNAGENVRNGGIGTTIKGRCLAACRKILSQIATTKEIIFDESRAALKTQEHLLRLALNEAEALTWQTAYSHLLFPALAEEKVRAVARWDARQRFIRRRDTVAALEA